MDLKQLQSFVTIAQEGSISAAAKKLHISQPPLSQQLKALERELGVVLLERGPRHVQLTDAGQLLYERALGMLELARVAASEMEEFSRSAHGVLRLGAVSSSGAALLRGRMAGFLRRYPGLRFELREGNTFQLLELLRTGLIELAVVRTPFPAENLRVIPLQEEPMALSALPGVWQQYQLEGEGPLPPSCLGQLPLMLYRRFESLIREVCRQQGVLFRPLCMMDDARTCLQWAAAGLGVAVTPATAARMAGGQLAVRPIDCSQLTTRLAVVYKAKGYLSPPAFAFLEGFSGAWAPAEVDA